MRKIKTIAVALFFATKGFIEGFAKELEKQHSEIRRADLARQRCMDQIQATTAIIQDMEYGARVIEDTEMEAARRMET